MHYPTEAKIELEWNTHRACSCARICAIVMAEAAHARGSAIAQPHALRVPRHSAVVRITHWLSAISFIALVLSGITILLAHPRLYWGETGAVGTPSLIDLPLPFVLEVPIRGPGRYLHFLAAWICVFTGLLYVLNGFFSRHFRRDLLPSTSDLRLKHLVRVLSDHLRFRRPAPDDALTYNVLQRLTYLAVIFILLPLMIWTGLAMSPAITSVFPYVVTVFGGQQSARTIHFFVANLLVLFFVMHVVMICRAGFSARVRAMITGHVAVRKERT